MNYYLPEITADHHRVTVKAPYNQEFRSVATRIGGVFRESIWTFSARDELRVRKACLDHYGFDGIDNPICVDVSLYAQLQINSEPFKPIQIFARPIARVTSKNAEPLVAHGTITESGGIYSRGPVAIIEQGTKLVLRDVPLTLYESQRTHIEGLQTEKLTPEYMALEFLFYEAKRYQERINEINALMELSKKNTRQFKSIIDERECQRLESGD